MSDLNWCKLGKIFEPNGYYHWNHSHAQVPFTYVFDDFVRIYFSSRSAQEEDGSFKSYTSFVDLSPNDDWSILEEANNPILELGGIGEFDESGIMGGSIVQDGNQFKLFYCGWQRLKTVPYNWAIGVAVSEDLRTFEKISRGPIIGPRLNEPYLHACPIVYRQKAGFKMFLLSGDRWIEDKDGKLESVYTLKETTSEDGINWTPLSKPLLQKKTLDECQTSCSIFEHKQELFMVFSYRSGLNFRTDKQAAYKIGLAKLSSDGSWERIDEELTFSSNVESQWDDTMMAYPHVFSFNAKLYMLYCGNKFGRNGFGIAELID